MLSENDFSRQTTKDVFVLIHFTDWGSVINILILWDCWKHRCSGSSSETVWNWKWRVCCNPI